ncbi:hypothetical protein [Sinorhizobium americanum]|uniref:hypothetical protein n=1 Tax=Sinorhizobium americanum TaxID=194963 RepID=UPI00055F71EC|nr:hypothetical protein [Sinorhizobium americanum]
MLQLQINGQRVVFHGQVALAERDTSIRLSGEKGLEIEVDFTSDNTGKASVLPRFSHGIFRITLANFGSPLGMAVSGTLNATTVSPTGPGTWGLKYTVACQTIGDERPNRLVNLTIVEARLA